jgi:hypothetical protein
MGSSWWWRRLFGPSGVGVGELDWRACGLAIRACEIGLVKSGFAEQGFGGVTAG